MSTTPTLDEVREALRLGVVRFLTSQSYTRIATGARLEHVLPQYFDLEKRTLRAVPRTVERATSAQWAAWEPAIADIERELRAGVDMLPRMSRKLAVKRSAEARDDLVSDWRLHHFHLAPRGNDGTVPDGREVLVAWVDYARALLLGVIAHDAWGDPALFDRLSSQWPGVVAAFRLSDAAAPSSASVTNDERILLRRNGINAITVGPGGAAYAPPGGGISLSGRSIEASRRTIAVTRALRDHYGDLTTLASELHRLSIPVRLCHGPLSIEVLGLGS
jgi:hypothetical protein